MNNRSNTAPQRQQKRFGALQVFAIVSAAVVVAVIITLWVSKTYIFPSEFKPVTLSSKEEKQLAAKLKRLDIDIMESARFSLKNKPPKQTDDLNAPLEPEPYTEEGASREIQFTERELNALLATNTDLARKVAIDLSDNLISARLRIPVDPDFPILGGKIIRAHAGLELAYKDNKPIVKLKGVKLMGVPIPNAWLGGIKNIDLVQEFGGDKGFWKGFSEGVDSISVEEGRLSIKLKE